MLSKTLHSKGSTAFASLYNLPVNRESLRDLMREQMAETGHKFPVGYSLAEIEAAKQRQE